LDKLKQPVPIGMAGELYIGGYGVARGYLNRPELTAEKFLVVDNLANPQQFDSGEGGWLRHRLYRTGDLGRYLPDGNIEFLGRVDFQVKLRGFRIELEEIEAILSQHDQVQQAAVMVRSGGSENTSGAGDAANRRLVAYIVPEVGKPLSVNDMRTYLRQHLPEYMVPSVFLMMDAFPLTSNGKVDRKALPDIDGARPDLDSTYVPPQTELERKIARIWQEVLSIEKVGLNDNFFDLGGHSLLMFKAHTRLQDTFSRDFSMVELFRYPTISALANYLSKGVAEVGGLTGGDNEHLLQKTQERADQQKDAMKRQVDRMREIANSRAAAVRQSAMKKVMPQPGAKKPEEPK
jgi:acyl carrier protein